MKPSPTIPQIGQRIRIIALVCLFVAAMPAAGFPEPEVNIQKKHYPVFGRTAEEIREDLNRQTLVIQEDTPYDARTECAVNWEFQWEFSEEMCRITGVQTRVDVVYILPKLDPPPDIDMELLEKWEAYMEALTRHEDGHKDFGIAAAREIETVIKKLPPLADCGALEAEANHQARAVLLKFRELEDEYDLKTDHGQKTGVVFP